LDSNAKCSGGQNRYEGGYSAYSVLPNITHAACMAHAQRKFDEAMGVALR